MDEEKINAIINTILDNIGDDALLEILQNVVKYSIENNHTKTNWTAREFFSNIVSEELLEQLFDEEEGMVMAAYKFSDRKGNIYYGKFKSREAACEYAYKAGLCFEGAL